MSTTEIKSVEDLVKQLGGPKAAGIVFGTTAQNVVNWKAAGAIPPKHFLRHQEILRVRGMLAPAGLWGFASEAAE